MLQSILVVLDASPSAAAVKRGIRWGKALNALLVGLGLVDEPAIRRPEAESLGAAYYERPRDTQVLENVRREVQAVLERFSAECAAVGVACKTIENVGLPYAEILRESKQYDLVLFGYGTHLRFRAGGRPDETLWHVLKQGPRPVVIVPEKPAPGSSVVIAYNGSPQADRALQAFQVSGLDFGEEVHVVTVDTDHGETVSQNERAGEFLQLHGLKAQSSMLKPKGTVAQTILEEVRRRQARLLVMGAYGHSTVREFILGSVTNEILKDSPVPVFLCH
jgi:nucleotide-binding universal stress UspA family protein